MAGRSKKKPLSRRQGLARYLRELEVVDYRLIISIVFLCVFGLIMIYSASAAESGVSLVLKQFGIGAGGFVLMWIVSYVDYHFYEKIAGIIYIGAVLSMFLVKVPGLGVTRNGASRWIDIGPFSFQPSEFVKPAMVILMAYLLTRMGRKLSILKADIVLLIPGVIAVMVILVVTRNLSTALIVLGIIAFMFFIAYPTKKIWRLIAVIGVVIVVGWLGYYHFVIVPNHTMTLTNTVTEAASKSFRDDRILAWLYPDDYPADAYQQQNSIMAIGSGQLWGKGLNNTDATSVKNGNFIPEPQTDFIFAVAGEELGFIGTVIIIILLLFITIECILIARKAKDTAGKMICCGFAALVGFQSLVNIGVASGVLPNTGLPLPFVSYGLTSLLSLYIGVGLVLNVGLQPKKY